MLLQSSPTSFLFPPPSLASSPRSASSAPFCPLVGKQGQIVGLRLTPSAKRRKVEVMANSAPAAAGMPLSGTGDPKSLRLLFVEMGTGYDQHGYVFGVLHVLVVSFRPWAFVEYGVFVRHSLVDRHDLLGIPSCVQIYRGSVFIEGREVVICLYSNCLN